MRSAVFIRTGVLDVVDRARPTLADPADVLVQVEACGICGTDLHILQDPPGTRQPRNDARHEMVGRVVACALGADIVVDAVGSQLQAAIDIAGADGRISCSDSTPVPGRRFSRARSLARNSSSWEPMSDSTCSPAPSDSWNQASSISLRSCPMSSHWRRR